MKYLGVSFEEHERLPEELIETAHAMMSEDAEKARRISEQAGKAGRRRG